MTLIQTRTVAGMTLAVILAACGGVGPVSEQTSDPGDSQTAPGSTLTLDLPDSASVVVGRSLKVEPRVSGQTTGRLTYAITNGPSWLSMSPTTGELSGTPTAADIGTYERIRVTASDGTNESYAFITINVTMTAQGRATVSWQAPTERTDGSPLTDLAGFRVYFGESAGRLQYVIDVSDAGARSHVVTDLTSGTWFFAATAYDASGAESSRSNVASKVIS